jgi:nitrite reductase (NADH) large subunit
LRVIIVGNGLAGIISAKTLRELDKKVEIDIFTEEKYHYYPRPNLIEFLAGTIPLERMFAFSQEWYREQNINIHLGKPITRIFPDSQEIEVAGGKKEKYESLLLANGSFSFIPPFKGTDKKGIFALRALDDALELLEYLKNHQRVVIIGGGLLGLEIARAMKSRGARVDVVEFFDRLLPRQLDIQGASLLKSQIENTNINVHLGLAAEEILGLNDVKGLRFKGEREIEMDMAVVAAGVRPNIRLAKEAGLETDRGLVTDDYLRSSNSKIFGAGDVIQHRGRVYGIIPSSFNQARVVASNILGKKEKYEGTVPSNTLKVAGLDLTSVGLVNPEEGTSEEFRKEKKEEGIYKKVVIQKGVVVGAIWMGTKKGVNEINRLISQKINIEKHKISLLEDDFDYSVL